MKKIRKIAALVLAAVMVMAMGSAAFAAEQPSTPQIKIHTTSDDTEGQTDTTLYTWYRIFDADIETDPAQRGYRDRPCSAGNLSERRRSRLLCDYAGQGNPDRGNGTL